MAEIDSWVCTVQNRDVVGIVDVGTRAVEIFGLSMRRKLDRKACSGHDVVFDE